MQRLKILVHIKLKQSSFICIPSQYLNHYPNIKCNRYHLRVTIVYRTKEEKNKSSIEELLLHCSWVIVQVFNACFGPQRNELKLLTLNSRLQMLNISTSWMLGSELICNGQCCDVLMKPWKEMGIFPL